MKPNELTDKQKQVMNKITVNPQTAAQLGAAAATLTSLVKKGLIRRVGDRSPYQYAKISSIDTTPGGVIMHTVDGDEYEMNTYTTEKDVVGLVVWYDNNDVKHEGKLLRSRPEDNGYYIRAEEFRGAKFIPATEIKRIERKR